MSEDTRTSTAAESVEGAAGLISKEEIDKIVASQRPQTQVKPKETQSNPDPVKSPEAGKQNLKVNEEEPRQVEAGKEDKKPEPSPEIKTVFGSVKIPGKTEQESLETFEDLQAYAKKHDLELKSLNDIQDVFKEWAASKTAVSELEKYKSEVDNFNSIFSNLPEELSAAVNAHLSGQDFRDVLVKVTGSNFDLRKNFDDHNTLKLINHYTEEDITSEEWEEIDDRQKKLLQNAAKRSYQADQRDYKEAIEKPQRTAQEFQQKFQQSVEDSILRLKRNYPEMGEAQVARVREIMTRDFQSTLFNQDNTYKAESAERIAMQEYGAQAIKQYGDTIADYVARFNNQIESRSNERMVRKSDLPDTEQGRSTQDRDNVISDAVKQGTDFLD